MSEAFLPSTARDCAARGWPGIEVLLVTADPHVDHPSFGALLVGRYLENRGVRVGLVCQPRWRGSEAVSYTHLRAHETVLDLVCRLLLEKKKNTYIHFLQVACTLLF